MPPEQLIKLGFSGALQKDVFTNIMIVKNIQRNEAMGIQSTSTQSREALYFNCDCGYFGYVQVKDALEDYSTVCRNCRKTIYGVNCSACQSGYAFPDGAKELDVATGNWTCPRCKSVVPISEDAKNNSLPNYSEESSQDTSCDIVAEKKTCGLFIVLLILLIPLAIGFGYLLST